MTTQHTRHYFNVTTQHTRHYFNVTTQHTRHYFNVTTQHTRHYFNVTTAPERARILDVLARPASWKPHAQYNPQECRIPGFVALIYCTGVATLVVNLVVFFRL